MSTLTDSIDSTLQSYLPGIMSKQAQVFTAYGHYFQGLPSSSVVPADGANATIDNWDSSPSYAEELTWRAAWGGDPPSMQSQLTIDQYVGPQGAGWVLTARVIEAGAAMRRSINFGPAAWMDSGGWVVETTI